MKLILYSLLLIIACSCSSNRRVSKGCKDKAKFSKFAKGFKENNVSDRSKKTLQNYRKK